MRAGIVVFFCCWRVFSYPLSFPASVDLFAVAEHNR
jgi:hypothetical protein